MSGGVDSSVSAALLKEEGYDVTGVFMKVWQPDFLECSRGDDRREAMRAAAHLKIPFLTFDFEKEYKKEVIDYMVREYKAGRTPNPDVMCNQRIKFGAFFQKARAMGADFVATGHYARIGVSVERLAVRRNSVKLDPKRYTLYAGRDKNKDQSYFLWTLTQEHLKHTLFPVGGLLKSEVRALARKFGLPNAERKESQGLCFVGEFKLKDFLEHFIPPRRGEVVTDTGEVVGHHDGAVYYTLGQRHGFIVTKKTPNEPPYYIVQKNVKKNILIVSHKGPHMRGVKETMIHNVHFVSGKVPDMEKAYKARFRYRQPLVNVKIKKKKSKIVICFEKLQEAVTPGQSLVMYNGEECIGGGIIE